MATRKTRSGASYLPYDPPPASSHRLIRIAAASRIIFNKAAQRTSDELNASAGPDGSQAISPPSCASKDNDVYDEIAGTHPPPPTAAASVPFHPVSPPPSNSKNAGKRRRRSERRKAAALARAESSSTVRPVKASTARKHRKMDKIAALLPLEDLPHAAGGSWIGLRTGGCASTTAMWRKRVPSVEELMSTGQFQYVPYQPGNIFVVDSKDRVVASLIDRPTGADWPATCAEAARCLRAAHDIGLEDGVFGDADMSTRRGDFLQVPVGPSMGGGQQRPTNLFSNHPRRHKVNRSILKNRAIQRIAGVQSSAFAFTSPLLFGHYRQELEPLFENDPTLRRNFPNSIFPAASFNCSDQSTSLAHFDFNNLSFGQCALTPLGDFDHRLGGHIVVYTLGLIFEFPCGTTFTLPSAAFEHGNTRVAPGQTRRSIAQYAAGGLFRWKAYGFRTAQTLSKTAVGRAHLEAVNQGLDERWKEGLKLYSTVESLTADYNTLNGQFNV